MSLIDEGTQVVQLQYSRFVNSSLLAGFMQSWMCLGKRAWWTVLIKYPQVVKIQMNHWQTFTEQELIIVNETDQWWQKRQQEFSHQQRSAARRQQLWWLLRLCRRFGCRVELAAPGSCLLFGTLLMVYLSDLYLKHGGSFLKKCNQVWAQTNASSCLTGFSNSVSKHLQGFPVSKWKIAKPSKQVALIRTR